MKSKLKNILISFISMIIMNIVFSLIFLDFGAIVPHVGLLYVLGLLLGPYGALGATLGNIVIDLMEGYPIINIIPSAIITFGISFLAYKLWYSGFKTDKITKPQLNNIYHIVLFLSTILICGFIYSIVHGNLICFIFDNDYEPFYFIMYLLNFVNIAFIF